jgi:hypothetical protein
MRDRASKVAREVLEAGGSSKEWVVDKENGRGGGGIKRWVWSFNRAGQGEWL